MTGKLPVVSVLWSLRVWAIVISYQHWIKLVVWFLGSLINPLECSEVWQPEENYEALLFCEREMSVTYRRGSRGGRFLLAPAPVDSPTDW